MKRTVRAVVLAVAITAMVVPVVSADGGDWRARTFDCGAAGSLAVVLPPSEYSHALVPFHVVGSGSVLVPLVLTVDGDTYAPKPLAARLGDRLVRCEYVDPFGYDIVITGFLTPAR